ncbi:YetF domain-containing protein [Nigerium massiliense]|uniref:YetF domain-containing protein n=1 Tax=Nigerium massiliense TaxID=1522317 RepID=UPI001C4803AF|nr:YetF domain-containing protein [Nigerium massiliense]
MSDIWSHLGITPVGALSVLLATVVLYVLFVTVLRVAGPRLLASTSVLSFAVTTLLGALTARSMLGDFPTLGGGVVAVVTLLVLELTLGRLASLRRMPQFAGARARVVMVNGSCLPEQLRHRGLTEQQLHGKLRRAGVVHLEDAVAVILENRGGLTIIRRGDRIDAALLDDIVGRDLIPADAVR